MGVARTALPPPLPPTQEWAVQGGLLPRLHLLWAWCLVSPSLQWALLSLLCTLTAQCSKGVPLRQTEVYIKQGTQMKNLSFLFSLQLVLPWLPVPMAV